MTKNNPGIKLNEVLDSHLYAYEAYGLRIHAEFALPELAEASGECTPDIVIRFEAFDLTPLKIGEVDKSVAIQGNDKCFYWKSFGAFLVRDNDTILVHPHIEHPIKAIRIPLLGVVLGTLLHQRGLFTLHASAVVIDGSAVAFLGEKRAGKSTTAAALNIRGHEMLTDDVLALQVFDNELPVALPGFPQFKLSRHALAELNGNPEEVFELHPEIEKRAYRPRSGFQRSPIPMKRIYVLMEGERMEVKPISGREAFMELVRHSYAMRFLGSAGITPVHFEQCRLVTENVEICTLARPYDLEQLPDLAAFIEKEVEHIA